jgi:hypothetical protein
MSQDNPTTIAEAEAIAQKYGITLAPQDYADMQAVMDERQRQLERQFSTVETKRSLSGLVEAFNRLYPKFLRALLGISDVFITAAQTVLIAFGVPALLVMLMIVEQQRVNHGMSLFEIDAWLAGFGATVLVLANLVFELLIGWKEHQAGYTEPAKTQFSLRLLAQQIAYMTGHKSDWQPRQKSPAQRFKAVLRIITFTILSLALAGSMRSIIQETDGNWAEAIRYVVTRSTLLQMATWLGGLLFAFAAVLSAQALSAYVAGKVIEVIAVMQSRVEDKPSAIMDAVGMTGAAFLVGRIKEAQRNRRMQAAMSTAVDMPVAPAMQGSVNLTVDDGSETVKAVKARRCLHCKKLLPKNARATRKYCSDACRVAAFTERKHSPNGPSGTPTAGARGKLL